MVFSGHNLQKIFFLIHKLICIAFSKWVIWLNLTFLSHHEKSATPALVIPVKGGKYFRFRLGAGPGYYGGNRMKISASDAGGPDVTLRYESAFGIHGSFIFESIYSEKGSYSVGLKYYNVNYKFTPEGSTGISRDQKTTSPDGSGLDFSFGYFYRF